MKHRHISVDPARPWVVYKGLRVDPNSLFNMPKPHACMQCATRSDAIAWATTVQDTHHAHITPDHHHPHIWIQRADVAEFAHTPYDIIMIQADKNNKDTNYCNIENPFRPVPENAPSMVAYHMGIKQFRDHQQVQIGWKHRFPRAFGIELSFIRSYMHRIDHQTVHLDAAGHTIEMAVRLLGNDGKYLPLLGNDGKYLPWTKGQKTYVVNKDIPQRDYEGLISAIKDAMAARPSYDSQHHRIACLTALPRQLPDVLSPTLFDTMQDHYVID